MMKHKPQIKQHKISFDFDGTLEDDFDGTLNTQKYEIQDICKYFVEQGKDVYIITKRYEDTIEGESGKVYEMAKKLGVSKVYFTNRVLKDVKIAELDIELHFENNPNESEVITNNSNAFVICIEDSYWRDLVY